MSISKADITVSLASKLITTQFPQWAHLPVRPVAIDGWDNTTFRLGDEMTIRLPSAERYLQQVAKEHEWLPRLAPFLPLPIPAPLAKGSPSEDYPWHWSVYRWIEGETATAVHNADPVAFAIALAQFLAALYQIEDTGGPPPGPHNFYRGGSLAVYDEETRRAIAALNGVVDTDAATEVWETALRESWSGAPVWIHGDVSATNLLVREGKLCAVIDFGSSGVGDPACDLTIAWTFLSGESREAFYTALPIERVDAAAWARARGWTLWKGLITLAEHRNTKPSEAEKARHAVAEVIADHQRVRHY